MLMQYVNYDYEASAEEMAIYNKVENALNGDEWDMLVNLMATEPDDNLYEGKIENEQTLAFIKQKELTVLEVCIWYALD